MTNRVVIFSHGSLPNVLKIRPRDATFQLSGKQESFEHILKRSSLECNQDQRPLREIKVSYDLLDHLRSYRNIMQF